MASRPPQIRFEDRPAAGADREPARDGRSRPRKRRRPAAAPPPRRGFFGAIFGFFGAILRLTIASAIFFVLLVIGSYIAIGYYIRGETIIAPNVTAQQVDDALDELRRHNLSLQLKRTEPSDSLPAGAILSQDPRPGYRIKTQTPIRVVVSSGPHMVEVPRNLVGIGRLQAGIELRRANLDLGNVAVIDAPDRGHDVVLASDPPPGSSVIPGSPVNLLVSSESSGAEILMPDLFGLTPDRARSELARADLELESSVNEWHPTAAPGTIHRQEPAPGTPITQGAQIRVYVNPPRATTTW